MSELKAPEFELVRQLSLESPRKKSRQFDKLSSFLLKFRLFQDIKERNGLLNFHDITNNYTVRIYNFGEAVYKTSESRTFNYIIKGSVTLFTNRSITAPPALVSDEEEQTSRQEYMYKKLKTGDYFGQRLYAAQSCRITSAKATSHTFTIQLDLPTLYKTFYGYFVFKELEDKVAVLRNVVALRFLSTRKLQRILQLGITRKVHNGEVLFREDDEPHELMIVLAGEVTLSRKDLDSGRKNMNLSILPAFEVLGFTEIIRGDRYYSTAMCTRDRSQILSIDKQLVREMFDYQLQSELDVYRYKEDWRKTRAEIITRTTSKYRDLQSSTQQDIYANNKYLRMLTEPNDDPVEFGLEDRRKLFMTELESSRRKRVVRRFLTQDKMNQSKCTNASSDQRCTTSMGDHLYNQYMLRKTKKDLLVMYKYASGHAPEMVENPQLEYTPMRPLYVHRSSAVRNTKRQLKASRRRIFEEFLGSSKTPGE